MTHFPICPNRSQIFPSVTTQFGTNWGFVNSFRENYWPHRVVVDGGDVEAAVAWCYENIGPKLVEIDGRAEPGDDRHAPDRSVAYWTAGRWDYLMLQVDGWSLQKQHAFWFESDIEATAFRLAFGAAE